MTGDSAACQVIPAEEHAKKIAAARDAIGDADFFLVARTDARATSKINGLKDAIDRANLYMDVSNFLLQLCRPSGNCFRYRIVMLQSCF